MPSSAYKHFRKNVIDVHRLIEAHSELTPNHPGKRGLGHITRSGIVMLCACWEQYVEAVLIESARKLALAYETPDQLPLSIKKHLSKRVKSDKHELKPLELSGYGWRSVYDAFCCTDVGNLNTPKTENLKELYGDYLGINNISNHWKVSGVYIDDFVSLRGDIAHQGRSARYVSISELEAYEKEIYLNCLHMDNSLCNYIHGIIGGTVQPWRKATK
tara:strand:+ start:86 stop:733 length:648 start_codon:yes stop_codon:yes gene_type:complete